MQMPSGNKIIGNIYNQHIILRIYISSRTVTQGLCGSFDGNRDNDIFHRYTNRTTGTIINGRIEGITAASWRLVRITSTAIYYNKTVYRLIWNWFLCKRYKPKSQQNLTCYKPKPNSQGFDASSSQHNTANAQCVFVISRPSLTCWYCIETA